MLSPIPQVFGTFVVVFYLKAKVAQRGGSRGEEGLQNGDSKSQWTQAGAIRPFKDLSVFD